MRNSVLLIVLSLLVACCNAWALDSLTVTDFGAKQVIQRTIGGSSASVTVSGTYTGTAEDIDARVVQNGTSTEVVTWTNICTASGGAFSGSLSVPEGGWYNVQVRGHTTTGVTSNGSHKWGVGILAWGCGQSNMYYGCGANNTNSPYDWWGGTDSPNEYTSMYEGGWKENEGNLAVNFANDVYATEGVPVAVISCGVGGAALRGGGTFGGMFGYWLNEASGSPYYNAVAALNAVGGDCEFILWYQGESDAWDFGNEACYEADLATLYGRFQSETHSGIPFLIAQLGRENWMATDAAWEAIKNAQRDYANDTNNVYLAATNQDATLRDSLVHLDDTGYRTCGKRFAQTANHILGNETYHRGPYLGWITRVDSTHIDINLKLRAATDYTPTSSITGFSVLNDGTPVSVSSAAQQDADTIRLTTAETSWGTTITARYLYGHNPTITGVVKGNDSLTLPLEGGSITTESDPGSTDPEEDPQQPPSDTYTHTGTVSSGSVSR